MKREEKLIAQINAQIKIFKSRSIKGPSDGKRHDPVLQDEQRWMYIAQSKLGWSDVKIGNMFERDRRTVRNYVESYQRQQPRGEQEKNITPERSKVEGGKDEQLPKAESGQVDKTAQEKQDSAPDQKVSENTKSKTGARNFPYAEDVIIYEQNRVVNEPASGDTNNAEQSMQKSKAAKMSLETTSPIPMADSFATASKRDSARINLQRWAYFDRMVDLILSLEAANNNDRPHIMANIQRELTQIGDSKLDEIMKPFQDLEDWEEEFGAPASRGDIEITLLNLRKYMNQKYKRS